MIKTIHSSLVCILIGGAVVAGWPGAVQAQEAAPAAEEGGEQGSEAMSADEVLRLVRYSYTLTDKDFRGALRTGGIRKVDFVLSLKPDSIRFLFDNPAQVIQLDTKDQAFVLSEGLEGAALAPVDPSRYNQTVRDTDITYDDLSMRFLYWPHPRIVRTERVKGRNCWLVRVRNPDGRGAYATVDVSIDQGTGGMLKMIGYNAGGRPIRRFEVLHGKKFDDIWMVDEMRIETIDPDAGGAVRSSTRMQLRNR